VGSAALTPLTTLTFHVLECIMMSIGLMCLTMYRWHATSALQGGTGQTELVPGTEILPESLAQGQSR